MNTNCYRNILTSIIFSVFFINAATAAPEQQTWPPTVKTPTTRLVLEATVTIGDTVEIGKSDAGVRRFIPITGGYFRGEGIQGKVASGGADWQLVRSDGVLEIDALYSLITDDGSNIVVHNQGIVVMNKEKNPNSAYVKTSPKFHAPEGKYEWLNKRIFVGTITPDPANKAVIIRVFDVM